MLYISETRRGIDDVEARLEDAVKARRFGVIAVVDLQAKMREKGVAFEHACRIYEICNPLQAKAVLERDLSVSTVLPCRISVYEENGKTRIATVLPRAMLALFGVAGLDAVAAEVEEAIRGMIDEAAAG